MYLASRLTTASEKKQQTNVLGENKKKQPLVYHKRDYERGSRDKDERLLKKTVTPS